MRSEAGDVRRKNFAYTSGTSMLRIALLFFLIAVADSGAADLNARADFMRAHPCPANDKSSGACPGYVIDHLIPLMCGGPDAPANMQWQTAAAAKAKDRWDTIGCRRGRRPQLITPVENSVEVFAYGASEVRAQELGPASAASSAAPVADESTFDEPEAGPPMAE